MNTCKVEDCKEEEVVVGYCHKHMARRVPFKADTCNFPTCSKPRELYQNACSEHRVVHGKAPVTDDPLPFASPVCEIKHCNNWAEKPSFLCSHHMIVKVVKSPLPEPEPEHTGLSVGYYDVVIKAGTHTNPEHNQLMDVVVSCNDIIEALELNYAQANVIKAQWRIAAAKKGKMKKGNNTKYDAEKSVFFSERVLIQEKK